MIFNRTQADIINAKSIIAKYQASSWLLLTEEERQQLERGTFTYNTLNRIEQAQFDIAELIKSYGYLKYPIANKTDWTANDVFKQSDINRLLQNINLLRKSWNVYLNTPLTPTDYKPYENTNALEKILFDMNELINKMVAMFAFSGQIYSGCNKL